MYWRMKMTTMGVERIFYLFLLTLGSAVNNNGGKGRKKPIEMVYDFFLDRER